MSSKTDSMAHPRRHYIGHRERLRRRILSGDADATQDYEIVELLLSLVVPRRDVKPQAKRLVARFGSVRGVIDATAEELQTVEGVGKATAENLSALRIVLTRYLQEKAATPGSGLNYEALREYCRVRLGGEQVEVFRAFFLNAALRVIGESEFERGSIDRGSVYPRHVIESALSRHATAVVLVHNHPSGSVTPSDLDVTLTKAVAMAAAPLDIRVLDHLVVAKDEVFSFHEAGLL